MNLQTVKALTIVAYTVLVTGIVIYASLASIEWGVFIAWPALVIGFVVWAALLTIADKYRGSDKKMAYRRNQTIFLVLLLLIIFVTVFMTAGKRWIGL